MRTRVSEYWLLLMELIFCAQENCLGARSVLADFGEVKIAKTIVYRRI